MSFTSTPSSHPLKDIAVPHPHDVLCGRGGGTNVHVGNSHWRMLISANKELYVTLPKRQKMLLSKSIVHAVRSQNPPGRFLQKDTKRDLWYDVGDQRAQEKTSQALREGAPEIRTKLQTDRTPERARSFSSQESSPVPPPASPREAHRYGAPSIPMFVQPIPTPVLVTEHGLHVPVIPPIPQPVEPQGPVPERKRNNKSEINNPPVSLDAGNVEPPALDPDTQFSFGSIAMTDMEEAKLMNAYSGGVGISFDEINRNTQPLVPFQGPPSMAEVEPVNRDLEPAGLSFGSVMSVGTADLKLENTGLSFGSMMSYVKEVAEVDQGLEAIGTSFGSLSMVDKMLESMPSSQTISPLQPPAPPANDAIPTFLQHQKSKGSLLDCSDSDSDDEHDSAQSSARKSMEWEKLKATLAAQGQSPRPNQASRPLQVTPTRVQLPTTSLDRDFSQMSAISVDFDGFGEQVMPHARDYNDSVDSNDFGLAMMPPPAPKKSPSEHWEAGEQLIAGEALRAVFD